MECQQTDSAECAFDSKEIENALKSSLVGVAWRYYQVLGVAILKGGAH